MNEKTKRIGFACLFGAFIGTICSLELAKWFIVGRYLWPLGTLLGGGIAYLTYNLKEVGEGICWASSMTISPKWWKAVAHRLRESFRFSFYNGAFFGVVMYWFGLFITVTVVGDCVINNQNHVISNQEVYDRLGFGLFVVSPIMFMFGAATIFSICFLGRIFVGDESDEYKSAKKNFINWNPVSVCLWLRRFFCRKGTWSCIGTWSLVTLVAIPLMLWKLGKWIKRYLCLAFIYIHSQERVLCFTDSAIGVTIGYFAGSAIIGAVIGCALGILNYEIVSVRWLKLVSRG